MTKYFPNNESGKLEPATVMEKYKLKKRNYFAFTGYITEKVGKNAKIKPQDFEMFFTIFIFIQRRPTKASRVLILRQKTTKKTTKQESKINKLVFLQSDAAISKQNVVNPLSKLIMYCYLRHKAL